MSSNNFNFDFQFDFSSLPLPPIGFGADEPGTPSNPRDPTLGYGSLSLPETPTATYKASPSQDYLMPHLSQVPQVPQQSLLPQQPLLPQLPQQPLLSQLPQLPQQPLLSSQPLLAPHQQLLPAGQPLPQLLSQQTSWLATTNYTHNPSSLGTNASSSSGSEPSLDFDDRFSTPSPYSSPYHSSCSSPSISSGNLSDSSSDNERGRSRSASPLATIPEAKTKPKSKKRSSDEIGSTSSSPSSQDETDDLDLKKQRQRERNRESASRYRNKKKAQREHMESSLDDLSEQIAQKNATIASLASENQVLKDQLKFLKDLLCLNGANLNFLVNRGTGVAILGVVCFMACVLPAINPHTSFSTEPAVGTFRRSSRTLLSTEEDVLSHTTFASLLLAVLSSVADRFLYVFEFLFQVIWLNPLQCLVQLVAFLIFVNYLFNKSPQRCQDPPVINDAVEQVEPQPQPVS